MIVKVRGKEFRIELVSNYCHRVYDEIVMAVASLTSLNVELHRKRIEYLEMLEAKKDKKELIEKYANDFNKAAEKVEQLKTEILAKRKDIIKELLESNDIEFDFEWWDKRTSQDDWNSFVLSCLDPDRENNPPEKKSKKK